MSGIAKWPGNDPSESRLLQNVRALTRIVSKRAFYARSYRTRRLGAPFLWLYRAMQVNKLNCQANLYSFWRGFSHIFCDVKDGYLRLHVALINIYTLQIIKYFLNSRLTRMDITCLAGLLTTLCSAQARMCSRWPQPASPRRHRGQGCRRSSHHQEWSPPASHSAGGCPHLYCHYQHQRLGQHH